MSSKILASLGVIAVFGVVACSTDETTTGSGGTTSASSAHGAAGPGGAGPGGAGGTGAVGPGGAGPGGAGPGGAGPGGAGPGGAGPGGAGPGGAGGGGGACQTCAEAITDGLTTLCPDSEAIYDALTECICVDNCPDADECQMTCMNGTIDNNCQQCIQQQCQQEFDECANDVP